MVRFQAKHEQRKNEKCNSILTSSKPHWREEGQIAVISFLELTSRQPHRVLSGPTNQSQNILTPLNRKSKKLNRIFEHTTVSSKRNEEEGQKVSLQASVGIGRKARGRTEAEMDTERRARSRRRTAGHVCTYRMTTRELSVLRSLAACRLLSRTTAPPPGFDR